MVLPRRLERLASTFPPAARKLGVRAHIRTETARRLKASPLSFGLHGPQLFSYELVRLPRVELGCLKHRPLMPACLPFHQRRRLVDQVGLEPTKLSPRIKNPLPLPLGALVFKLADRAGFEPAVWRMAPIRLKV